MAENDEDRPVAGAARDWLCKLTLYGICAAILIFSGLPFAAMAAIALICAFEWDRLVLETRMRALEQQQRSVANRIRLLSTILGRRVVSEAIEEAERPIQ